MRLPCRLPLKSEQLRGLPGAGTKDMTESSQESAMTPEVRQVQAGGADVRYWTAGNGGLVVILDGGYWGLDRLQEALAQSNRVVRIELASLADAVPGGPLKAEQEVARLAASVVAAVSEEKYTVIGASLSAGIALWQALQEPDRVEALALISPVSVLPTGDPATASAEELVAHPENASRVSGAGESVSQSITGVTDEGEVGGRLGEVGCATLVVFGLKDRMVAPEAARVYREDIPNSNISLVYDAGHAIMADRPEALIDAVADFVQRRETFVVGRQSGLINP